MEDKDWYDLGIKKERNRILGHLSNLSKKTKGKVTDKKLGMQSMLHSIKVKIGKPLETTMEDNNSDPNIVYLEGWGYLSHGAYQDIIREQERNRILGSLEVVKDGNKVIRYELSVDEYNKLTNGDEVGKGN